MSDEAPLFDPPPGTQLPRAKTLRTPTSGRPQWSRYKAKQRVPCDECIMLLHEADGVGPYARTAKWKCKTGAQVLLLCNEHADARRKEGQK